MKIDQVKTSNVSRLMSDSYNAATSGKHHENEIRFSFYNHTQLIKLFEEGRAKDLAAIGRPGIGKPCMVLASGPSLDEAMPLLKDWPYPIICSTSQASTCVHYGRDPDYILALDPDSYPEELDVDTWKDRKSTMILQPGVNPELVKFWPNELLLFRKLQPQTPFYDGPQKIGYSKLGEKWQNPDPHGDTGIQWRYTGKGTDPLITSQIPMLGCALAAQICIAKQLGFDRIYLVGTNFEFRRFTYWRYRNGAWVSHADLSMNEALRRWENNEVSPNTGERIVQAENGIYSSPMTIFYMTQVITAWRITECDIVNTAAPTLLTCMPQANFKEVIEKKGENIPGFAKAQIIETSEEYLASQNIYFLTVGKGIMPREFHDPLIEIPRSLREVKMALEQQGKGADMDIEANMTRIRKLWEKIIKNAS